MPHTIRWWHGAVAVGGLSTLMLLDHPVQRFAQHNSGNGADNVAGVVRHFGQPEVYGTVTVGLLAAGLATGRPQLTRAGGRLAASLALAGLTVQAAKYAFGRPRPEQSLDADGYSPFSGQASLPSGHSAMAFALATSLADDIHRPWATVGLYGMATRRRLVAGERQPPLAQRRGRGCPGGDHVRQARVGPVADLRHQGAVRRSIVGADRRHGPGVVGTVLSLGVGCGPIGPPAPTAESLPQSDYFPGSPSLDAPMSGLANIPHPHNEPVLSYAPGSAERAALKGALAARRAASGRTSRPSSAGARSGAGSPTTWSRPTATRGCWPRCTRPIGATIDAAVRSAVEAQRDWGHWRFEDRAAVFLKAADLLATTARQRLNAATMLGQSKTAFQAEIDSACELIDFLRFNVHFAERIYREQPDSAPGAWNRMDHRPLEGFVYAITPFNFTAIGGNLPTAPALMGNAVVWKPSHTAALSNWHFYRLLEEAGLPPGVINFVPGDSVEVSRRAAGEPRLRRHPLHRLDDGLPEPVEDHRPTTWSATARYPRIVGETGGKDFIVAHAERRRGRARGRRWCAGPTSTRGRSAARPRGRTSPTRSGPPSATGWWR